MSSMRIYPDLESVVEDIKGRIEHQRTIKERNERFLDNWKNGDRSVYGTGGSGKTEIVLDIARAKAQIFAYTQVLSMIEDIDAEAYQDLMARFEQHDLNTIRGNK